MTASLNSMADLLVSTLVVPVPRRKSVHVDGNFGGADAGCVAAVARRHPQTGQKDETPSEKDFGTSNDTGLPMSWDFPATDDETVVLCNFRGSAPLDHYTASHRKNHDGSETYSFRMERPGDSAYPVVYTFSVTVR